VRLWESLSRQLSQPTVPSKGIEHCREHRTPKILILDVDLKTLGWLEQKLQDAGLGATTITSVVEAVIR
jgi:hypothetical protein